MGSSSEREGRPRTPRAQAATPPARLARALPGVRGVRAHRRDGVDVLFVSGALQDAGWQLERAVLLRMADEPRAVVCDLSDVEGAPDPHVLGCLAGLGALVRDWPGIPLAVVAEERLRARLGDEPASRGITVRGSLHEALSQLARLPAPTAARRRLAPHPTAARAARDFLTGQLLDWKLPKALAAGSLVVSELVTNAMIYAQSEIDLTLARHETLVRIAVRDASTNFPHQRQTSLESGRGRGLVIVDGFSHAWGVLPCPRGGKVVWAVVDG